LFLSRIILSQGINSMRILTLFLIAFSFSVSAQTTTNVNIDDIDGVNQDLFAELDAGNIVVLKFFTDWCGICNSTAIEVVAIYNAYQTNGDPVVFWALDRDPNETNVDATNYRNDNAIPFPVIGEASTVAVQFGVLYQPEYYIVRPDRSYVKRINYSSMQTAVDEALASIATGIEDVVGGYAFEVAGNSITWSAPSAEKARLQIADASGRTVVNRTIAGDEKATFNNLNAGVYIYTLTQNDKVLTTGKIGLVK
jgi:thiol-disulfide isomerase/thioredoxin